MSNAPTHRTPAQIAAGLRAMADIDFDGLFVPAAQYIEVQLQKSANHVLAADHTGMRVDYTGLLGQCQRALQHTEPALAEMLRQLQGHLQELGKRWYTGDTAAVDEILQLYCIEREARAHMVANMQSPEPPKLWAIHIPGPDEYHAAPSKEAAEHMAKVHTEAMRNYLEMRQRIEHLDLVTAHVTPWPSDAESHADELREFDYAAWGLPVPAGAGQEGGAA